MQKRWRWPPHFSPICEKLEAASTPPPQPGAGLNKCLRNLTWLCIAKCTLLTCFLRLDRLLMCPLIWTVFGWHITQAKTALFASSARLNTKYLLRWGHGWQGWPLSWEAESSAPSLSSTSMGDAIMSSCSAWSSAIVGVDYCFKPIEPSAALTRHQLNPSPRRVTCPADAGVTGWGS